MTQKSETGPSAKRQCIYKGSNELLLLPMLSCLASMESVFVEELESNCCRQMPLFSAKADGQQEEEVGVAAREEVTFVNMSRDNANLVQMQWSLSHEKMKCSFINGMLICGDSNGVSEVAILEYLRLQWMKISSREQ